MNWGTYKKPNTCRKEYGSDPGVVVIFPVLLKAFLKNLYLILNIPSFQGSISESSQDRYEWLSGCDKDKNLHFCK